MLMVYLSAVITMVTVSTSTSTASLCKCFQQCCGNYCGKVLLCLMLVTVCYSTNTGMKDKRKCHRGTISPREPYFLEGEDINLICNRRKGRAKHLTFVRGRNSEEVPRKYITKINGTAIQLKIPNITAEDIDALEYNIQYRCVDRRKHSKCFDNVYVQLEYALRKPENLQCRDYNFNKMKCTWSHGVEYHLPHDMNITCEYRLDKTEVLYHTFGGFWMSCENLTSTSCYWDAENYPAPESTIDVRVSVTNTIRNVTKTITQTFYKFDIGKNKYFFLSHTRATFATL
ncbi:uncharacterized protein LOC132740417 isoform X2 [Ruditapes philippinarum]|uniref:uncharacterized protein LOC132740417 isoform X2 n=1 Tax=Ruditapes philippinarum TaxID=129788 RepID=UPI00295C18C4|nr:uncharacterized protein LOC132740417 isoform X2 [Ruditapes philippinarum]